MALRGLIGVRSESKPRDLGESSRSIAPTAFSKTSVEGASRMEVRCFLTMACHAASLKAGSKYFADTVVSILLKSLVR
jgi:hypothetical protein